MPAIKVRDEGRIERLVSLAYILSTRSEIHIEELCERLNVSKKQVEDDLNVLMFCGLPPYSPEQLFDIIIEDDFVSMYFNDVFIAPLRLSKEEIAQIVIALKRLESQASGSELLKVKETLGIFDEGASNSVVVVTLSSEFDEIIRESIAEGFGIDILYLSLNSASLSERTIFPVRIFATASISYLFAIDKNSTEMRLFRIDRIFEATKSSEMLPSISKPENAQDPDFESGSVFIEQKSEYVDLAIDDSAFWILDSYPNEEIDATKSIYRFYAPSAFFAARLLMSNFPKVRLVGGTIEMKAILEAMEKIQMTSNDLTAESK